MNRLGKTGEDAATLYLRTKGYKIMSRNYRSRFGEIDIVAKTGETVVFVEVKTRGKNPVDTPGSAVDVYKRQKLIKTAKCYIISEQLFDTDLRFDVIEVELYGLHCKIEHIENAFDTEGL